MYSHDTSVKLHQTDAAGLLFFGDQFTLAHDTYELFMESIGFNFARVIKDTDYLLAIVHAEADFKKPLYVGDRVQVRLLVETLGETSYTLAYELTGADNALVGTARTVHVCMDKNNRGKRPLPNDLRAALATHT